MKALVAVAIWTVFLVTANTSLAQSGRMMNDGMWSGGWMGFGGFWMPLLLVLLAVGVIALLFQRKGK